MMIITEAIASASENGEEREPPSTLLVEIQISADSRETSIQQENRPRAAEKGLLATPLQGPPLTTMTPCQVAKEKWAESNHLSAQGERTLELKNSHQ